MLSLFTLLPAKPDVPRQRRKALPMSLLAGDALFEAIVADVHNVSADIAATASALNGIVASRDARSLGALRNHLPRSSAGEALLPRAAVEAELLRRIGERYKRLLAGLAPTLREVEACIAAIDPVRLQSATLEIACDCAGDWRQLAVQALALVELIEPETRWRLSGAYSENSIVLCRALRQVAAGHAPGFDAGTGVSRPMLLQRRTSPRYAIDALCTVYHAGGAQRARALDISNGGMGLSHIPQARLRSPIAVDLRGRRLNGIVVWTREDRIGMQFAEPLADDDPLLGLAR